MKVDRSHSPQAMLDATGLAQYTDKAVVQAMPRGEGEDAEVCFFKLDRFVTDDELEEEYALRGLRAADPYSLAAFNTNDPAFAYERPNGTHWKDAGGRWCFVVFRQLYKERYLVLRHDDIKWDARWWFAGLRK